MTTRNVAAYRDLAVILIDQLKEIYIDGMLKTIDTTQWYPMVMRKEYALAFTVTETELDDPDQMLYENYFCGSERNYTGYCNAAVDKLIHQQSVEPDVNKRRQVVWQIDRYLAEDGGRPIIFPPRSVTCSYPQVTGITVGVNSPYNLWRMEDAWLDRSPTKRPTADASWTNSPAVLAGRSSKSSSVKAPAARKDVTGGPHSTVCSRLPCVAR